MKRKREHVPYQRRPARPVSCIFCNKYQKSRQLYLSHLQIHTGEKPYFCRICGLELSQQHAWKHHEFCHSDERMKEKCHLCERKFKTIKDVHKHLKSHLGERPFKCETCFKTFSSSSILKNHSKTHSDIKPFECAECCKKFRDGSKLKQHFERVHMNLRNHKCSFCNKSFCQKGDLATHFRVHIGEKPHSCGQCDKRFNYTHALKNHIRKYHVDDPLQGTEADCIFCEQQFKSKSAAIKHLRVHTEERPHFCKICSKELRDGLSLRCHKELHSTKPIERNFKCSLCESSFKTQQHLNSHTKGIHSTERLFKCDQCDLTFKFKAHWKKHKNVHLEGQFPCEQCGKLFKSPGSLKIHKRSVHDKIRPYECSMCQRKFTQRGHWMNHMKFHTGEVSNPIVCKLCNKSFTRPFGLTLHNRTVHEEVAEQDMLKCSICDKSFKSEAYLKCHMNIHKVATHECPICNKVFQRRHNLHVHLKRHTAEDIYPCKTCGKKFTCSSSRRMHEKTHLPKQHKCHICNKEFHQAGNLRTHVRRHGTEKFHSCLFCPLKFTVLGDLKNHYRYHLNERPFLCKLCPEEFTERLGLKSHLSSRH